VQLAKLRITTVAGYHAGNIDTVLPDREPLVVMDMTR
jgi:hypothetical protein